MLEVRQTVFEHLYERPLEVEGLNEFYDAYEEEEYPDDYEEEELEEWEEGIYESEDTFLTDSEEIFTEELLEEIFDEDYVLDPAVYIFINRSLNWQEYDVEELIYFVEKGNYVFATAQYFSNAFKDSLKFTTKDPLFTTEDLLSEREDSVPARFSNPRVHQEKKDFHFLENNLRTYFESIDTLNAEVLARNNQGEVNFIRIKRGKGAFLLCSSPVSMTNYHLLDSTNHAFISGALSYIPSEVDIYWDEYYKVMSHVSEDEHSLMFIFEQAPLRWAFWLVMGGMLIFVLFETKRKQRAIPIVPPKHNTSLEFTETIGRLYFQRKDHYNLASKKIKVLLEFIRRHFFLKTDVLTDDFMRSLSAKSGIPEEEIVSLCHTISSLRRKNFLEEEELIALNGKIEAFYRKCGR